MRRLRNEPVDEAWLQGVADAFCAVQDPRTMRRFFDEIFTPSERCDLALRWRLLQQLRAGIPQRQMARELGISLCRITRGSRVLKAPDSVAGQLLDREAHEPAKGGASP